MKKEGVFRLRLITNVFLVAATLFAFYLMYFRNEGRLLARGIEAFKYFTVLSNAFGGLMAAVWLLSAAWGRGEEPRFIAILKYTSAVCLGLTFVTVMVFLGPLYGYIAMLRSANLWFHLLIPLAAMAEFVLLNRLEIKRINCFGAMLPMAAYAVVYLIYNLVMGKSDDPFQYDWYGFLLWGWGVGIGIFAAICMVTFGIGTLLRFLNGKVKDRTQQ